MSWTHASSTQASQLVEGFRSMRRGALLMIIGHLLLGVGLVLTLLYLMLAMHVTYPRVEVVGGSGRAATIIIEPGLEEVMGPPWRIDLVAHFIAIILLVLAGGVIGLVGLYAYFVPGTRGLARAEPRYSTPATLIRIGYVWGLVLVIVGVVLLVVVVGAFILLSGLVLLLVGEIGLIILSFYLYDSERNALYLVAGILFVIGLFLVVISFIGWILMYVALGESIRKHLTAPTPPGPPPLPAV